MPPDYNRTIRSQYGQSWAQPSQMRNAFPMPLLQSVAESSSLLARANRHGRSPG